MLLVAKRTLTTALAPSSSAWREHGGHGFAARFGQELGIALEFAADEVLERGRDVAPDMLGPHGVALYEPFLLDDLHAGNRFGVDDNHDILPAFCTCC